MQLAILTDSPQTGQQISTRFGSSAAIAKIPSEAGELFVCAQEQADPRATVEALKDLGVTHLWLCEAVGALSPLLENGDWLTADDYIDGTRGQHYTFFDEQAGGYVQQVPAFDPASRAALLTALQAQTTRPFGRGVYVCVSNTRLETPAEALFWRRAGGHVVGRFLSPMLSLARELEIEVAALVYINRDAGAAGAALPFSHYEPLISAAWATLLT